MKVELPPWKIWKADEGLTLETSAFQIFHGGNSTFINSFDKTQFLFKTSVSLFFHNLFCLVLGYDTQDVGIITANVSDEDSLNAMCSKAQIILNCVGPVSWILY